MLYFKGYILKIFLLFLFLPCLIAACFSKTSSPAVEKTINKQLEVKQSHNALQLLLRHLRLTKMDLGINPQVTHADPFRLEKVNAFLKNPLKITASAIITKMIFNSFIYTP